MVRKTCTKNESFIHVLAPNSIKSFKPPCSDQNGRKSSQSLIAAGLCPFCAFLCSVLCRTSAELG